MNWNYDGLNVRTEFGDGDRAQRWQIGAAGSAGLPTDVTEDRVRGAYETGDPADRYVFGHGIVKHFANGQEQPDIAYSPSGQVNRASR